MAGNPERTEISNGNYYFAESSGSDRGYGYEDQYPSNSAHTHVCSLYVEPAKKNT